MSQPQFPVTAKADSMVTIGKGHSSIGCQDYAKSIVHARSGVTISVVSDGCSSAVHSEVGASIVVHTAMTMLVSYLDAFPNEATLKELFVPPTASANDLQLKLRTFASHLAIKLESIGNTMFKFGAIRSPMSPDEQHLNPFHASCSILLTRGDEALAIIYGDGAFVAHQGGNDYSVVNVEFNNNAPYYPLYECLVRGTEDYCSLVGAEGRFVSYHQFGSTLAAPTRTVAASSLLPTVVEISNASAYRSLIITSDGIDTFSTPDKPRLQLEEIVPLLTSFPILNDGFAARQKNILSHAAKTQGLHHHDDFSMAGVIHVPVKQT